MKITSQSQSRIYFKLAGLFLLLFAILSPFRLSAAITNVSISHDNSTISIGYSYTGEVGNLHIYIDADRNPRTGYIKPNYQALFGAEWLIEGDRLYESAFAGNTPEWDTWEFAGAVVRNNVSVSNQVSRIEWIIARSLINQSCDASSTKTIAFMFETTDLQFNELDVLYHPDYQAYQLTCDTTVPVVTPSPIASQEVPSYRIGVPGYFYPEPLGCISACYWTQIADSAPFTGISIVNPNSGPGGGADPVYVDAVNALQTRGVTVLGYVYTAYGSRSIDEVRGDIDRYYEWYKVDGIFLDEVSNSCDTIPYYRNGYNHIKSKDESGLVVINPGINTEQCFASVADIIVTFESAYEAYVNWQPSGWESMFPAQQFWHIVYDVTQENIANAVQLAVERNAGWVYLTSDNMGVDDNPYDTLPPETYWSEVIDNLREVE